MPHEISGEVEVMANVVGGGVVKVKEKEEEGVIKNEKWNFGVLLCCFMQECVQYKHCM